MLNKVLKISSLYDFYGALLTEKQQTSLELHYFQDLSLSEIAEQLDVSRQAVHDLLKRAEQILDEHEEKLHLVARYHEERQLLREVFTLLETPQLDDNQQVREAKDKLKRLIN